MRRLVWTVEELKKELEKDPENVLKRYRVVFAEGKGVAWDMARTWNKQKKVDVVDVETFAKKLYGNDKYVTAKERFDETEKNCSE